MAGAKNAADLPALDSCNSGPPSSDNRVSLPKCGEFAMQTVCFWRERNVRKYIYKVQLGFL